MDKAIVTAFMVIIGVVIATFVFNAVYPAVIQSSDALLNMNGRVNERLKSQIKIVHATGELDKNGQWQDTNGNGKFDVFIWVKNVGSLRVAAVSKSDVFFGQEGNFVRIPYKDDAGGLYPQWEGQDLEDHDSLYFYPFVRQVLREGGPAEWPHQ